MTDLPSLADRTALLFAASQSFSAFSTSAPQPSAKASTTFQVGIAFPRAARRSVLSL
jgi:hypothetical protein